MNPTIRRRNKNGATSPTEKSVYRSMLYLLRVFRNDEGVQNFYYIICCLRFSVIITADCEINFSALKLMKSPLKNRLPTEDLKIALLVAIEGDKVANFPFDKAINKFKQVKNGELGFGELFRSIVDLQYLAIAY